MHRFNYGRTDRKHAAMKRAHALRISRTRVQEYLRPFTILKVVAPLPYNRYMPSATAIKVKSRDQAHKE